jgi:hypothetical protein
MVDPRLKSLDGRSRRNFLKWTAAVGAVIGLDRAKFLDVLSDSAGSAMADAAACNATCQSVHIVAGDGGFAWFQLLFPHVEIAKANNDNFAFHQNGSQNVKDAVDTDKPFVFAPETPWQNRADPTKRISAFMAGQNQTHTRTPLSAASVGNGQSILAVAAAIQRATPSLIPVITVDDVPFGTAPGVPDQTNVGSSSAIVDLFDSAASRATLAIHEDAALYEAYYKAYLSLVRAANKPTALRPLRTGKAAANFLGKNLSNLLKPSDDDLARYGITGGTPTKLSEIGRTLITAAKAFKNGLTQSVVLPAMRDDPHGAFQDMANVRDTVAALGRYLDEFLVDLDVQDPSCSSSGARMSDSVVLTIHGDTPKNPRDRGGWPDGTPGDSNWIYVLGNGYLKTGWFGGVKADGSVMTFDPKTGADVAGSSASTSAAAGAAVAYAIAKGDSKRVADFNDINIGGIVNQAVL